MMYGYGDHMTGWGYGLMGISTLLFWALLIIGIIALIRYVGRTPRRDAPTAPRATPEELLAERFARGEIGTDEYRERLQALRGGGRPLSTT